MTVSLLMLLLGGFFIGGVYSFWKGGNRNLAIIPALLAVLCLVAAYLWSKG